MTLTLYEELNAEELLKSDDEWSDVEDDAEGEPANTEPADVPPHQPHPLVRIAREQKKSAIKDIFGGNLTVSPDSRRQQHFESTIARLESIYKRGRADSSQDLISYRKDFYETASLNRELVTVEQRVVGGRPISSADDHFYQANSGFRYCTITDQYTRDELSIRTLTLQDGEEIGQPAFLIPTDLGGPRVVSNLEDDGLWFQLVEMVIIGIHALSYLPLLANNGSFLNLGTVLTDFSYRLPGHSVIQVVMGKRFVHFIRNRLNLLGWHNTVPVLCEFFYSHHVDSADKHLHLIGFFRMLIEIQQEYNGPLIMVIPPLCPNIREGGTISKEEYENAKRDHEYLGDLATLYGYALGCPVLVMDFQYRKFEDTEMFTKIGTLPTAVLFSEKGIPTRAYHERISSTLFKYKTLLTPLGDRMISKMSCTTVGGVTRNRRESLDYL
jgi:hypothetical protein